MLDRVGRAALAALSALALVALLAPAAPAGAQAPEAPGAAAAILIDARDGATLLAKGPERPRAVASTTKLMTALLALERAKPGEVFAAPSYDALPVESRIDLRAGERMRVDDLLEALLLESANDAAVTLAEGISGSRPAFVRAMNERARQLGLSGTSYANPIGLDDPANYSTARDLATLTRRLLRDRRFARIVDMPSASLESGDRPRVVANRNGLVARYPFVDGVKTGHTGAAGYVLVGTASGRFGAKVISVVLGEPSEAARDADTLALLRYGLAQFRRKKVLDGASAVASAAIEHRDGRARLVPVSDVHVTVRRGQRVSTRVDAPEQVEGELAAGSPVGHVAVLRGGRVVRRVRLVTASRVPGAGPLRRVVDRLGPLLLALLALLVLAAAVAAAARASARRRASDREPAPRRRTI